MGRFRAFDVHELGRLAARYSGGELRFTVEQNVIFPHVGDEDVASLLADPFLQTGRFRTDPGTDMERPQKSQGGLSVSGRAPYRPSTPPSRFFYKG